MRIDRTFGQLVSGFHFLSFHDFQPGTVRNQIGLHISGFFVGDDNFPLLLRIFDLHFSCKLRDDGKTFRLSCLEELFDTRKTLCDIITCNSSGMERTHGQLCTRLTDGLGRDDTDCLSHLYRLTGSHVGTVAFCTASHLWLTGQHRPDLDLCKTCIDNGLGPSRSDHVIWLYKNFSCLRMFDLFCGITPCDSVLKTFDDFLSVHERLHIHARNLSVRIQSTVCFPDDQILRYVYKTSCQITWIGSS